MDGKIPARLRRAVDSLDIGGDELILEIGCGRGIAAALACARLSSGRITAIDRSAIAIAAARQRHRGLVEIRKACFVEAALNDFAGNADRFDVIFAVNVNLFWLDPAPGLAAVRRLLATGGRLFLFYEAPSASKLGGIRARLVAALAASRFGLLDTVETDGGAHDLLGIVARPATSIVAAPD